MSELKFSVIGRKDWVPAEAKWQAFLRTDFWDDWGKFQTQFRLYVFDENGTKHELGDVKIGEFGLQPAAALPNLPRKSRSPEIPVSFSILDDSFFSLGQDEGYYETIGGFSDNLRQALVSGLRDVVANQELWKRAQNEEVMTVSLLRSVSQKSVEEQFRRLLAGGARLSPYRFTYTHPKRGSADGPPLELSFQVYPDSYPPTNIHVLVGRNGVGKTYTLNLMTKALVNPSLAEDQGVFKMLDLSEGLPFANLVSVSFSAFDNFDILPDRPAEANVLKYSYIGLKTYDGPPKRANSPKSPGIGGGICW